MKSKYFVFFYSIHQKGYNVISDFTENDKWKVLKCFLALYVDTFNYFFDFSARNRKYSDPGTGQVRNVYTLYIISFFLAYYYLLMYLKKFKQEKN